MLFPRGADTAMTAVLLNTAGGVTGGDRFDTRARLREGCHLCLTTQAAERAYRAQAGETGAVSTHITAEPGARLDWLPQETLLFDGAALNRRLDIDLSENSQALIVEPLVLGRAEMGEQVKTLRFRDRVTLHRDGKVVFADRLRLDDQALKHLSSPALAQGNIAIASVLLAAPDADRHLTAARALMPEHGGVSLIRDRLLFARILAADSFALRKTLIPLLRLLGANPLPRTWMI